MKIKIPVSHPLGQKLSDVINRIIESRQYALDLAKDEFNASRIWAGGHHQWGGISGVQYESKPEGWKTVDKRNKLYMPKVKEKELWEKIKSLPKVKHTELTDLLGWPSLQIVGMNIIRFPGFSLTPKYVLLDIPEKVDQKILDGMIEITVSEFKKLKKV